MTDFGVIKNGLTNKNVLSIDSSESNHQPLSTYQLLRRVVPVCAFIAIIGIYAIQPTVVNTPNSIAEVKIVQSAVAELKYVKAVTWNLAAVNNNPFEYWITNDDPGYNRIMSSVSAFIDTPGDFDVPVKDIFTEKMFDELEVSMIAANWTGVSQTRVFWDSQYKDKKVISQFIKDVELGKKRLISMPDRVTNTINTVNEGVVMRPTVVNCYNADDLSTMPKWWEQWRNFIFTKEVTVKKLGETTVVKVRDMISKIPRSKYPSITAEEEEISIPLQTLCAAIFDAILVSMMNKIDGNTWQPLREDMCNKLNRKKTDRITQILQTTYASADIQFLQEVASSFSDAIRKKPLANIFDVYFPAAMDSKRDQNSFILLKKGRFSEVTDVTSKMLKKVDPAHPIPISDGDLLVLTAIDSDDGAKYILASFHGDTNGLATIPVVNAVYTYALTKPTHKLLFGMDANTYYKPEIDQQGMVQFAEYYTSKKMNSCYGPKPDPRNFTTFHARTHLQPQLNKAVRLEEKDVKGDKNPKDFILFFNNDFNVISTEKDNTGEGKYVENMVFPTLSFPSDHGVTSTLLVEKSKKAIKPKVPKIIISSSSKSKASSTTDEKDEEDKKKDTKKPVKDTKDAIVKESAKEKKITKKEDDKKTTKDSSKDTSKTEKTTKIPPKLLDKTGSVPKVPVLNTTKVVAGNVTMTLLKNRNTISTDNTAKVVRITTSEYNTDVSQFSELYSTHAVPYPSILRKRDIGGSGSKKHENQRKNRKNLRL